MLKKNIFTLIHLLILTITTGPIWILSSCTPEYGGPTPQNYELFVEAQDKYPAFSPDGEYIAYYHYSSELPEPAHYPSGLYIIDKEGDNRQLVLEGHHYNPAWSPNGQWLVFSSQGVIQKCKINGDSLMDIQNNKDEHYFFPTYNPNGSNVLFDRLVNESGSLLIANSNFQELPQIYFNQLSTARNPEFSPDGHFLLYMKGSQEWALWELFKFDINQNHETRLTHDSDDDRDPTWSPNGKKIAWSSDVRIHTMSADGTGRKFLSYGNYPSWSLHNEIVFSHANNDYSKEVLYLIKPDGSGKRPITF